VMTREDKEDIKCDAREIMLTLMLLCNINYFAIFIEFEADSHVVSYNMCSVFKQIQSCRFVDCLIGVQHR